MDNSNKSVQRAIDILTLVSKNQGKLTISDISSKLSIPKSSVFDIVQTLLNNKLIFIDKEQNKTLSLDYEIFALGNSYLRHVDSFKIVQEELKRVSNELGRTAFIGVRTGNKVTYIYKYEPKNAITTSCKIGSSNELHCTGLGKCLIAFDSDFDLRGLALKQKTPYTITNIDKLKEELEMVRKLGYAIDDRENELSLKCISVPVLNMFGKIEYSLSITGLLTPERDYDFEIKKMLELSKFLSKKLGYLGD